MEEQSASQWKREQVFVQVQGVVSPLADKHARFHGGGVQDDPHLSHLCRPEAHEEHTRPTVVHQTIRHALIRYGVPAMNEHSTRESAEGHFQPSGFMLRNSAGSIMNPILSSNDTSELPVVVTTMRPPGPNRPTTAGALLGAHAGHGQSTPNMECWRGGIGPQSARTLCSSTSSPSLRTSMAHRFQASQRDPVAHQSERETAQARRSLEALVGKTTLVVRNIPAGYTQQDMLSHVWEPNGTFDFLFMPHSFKLGHTVGYLFMNFTCTSHAQAFHRQWHRATLPGGRKAKPLDIHAACFQGLYENMKYLANSDVMRIKNPRFQPSIFNGTRSVNFFAVLQSLGLLESDA